MSKSIKLNVDVSTNNANREIKNLQKNIDNLQGKSSKINKSGYGGRTDKDTEDSASKYGNPDFENIFDDFEKTTKSFERTVGEFSKTIRALRNTFAENKTEKTTQSSEDKTPKPKNDKKSDEKDFMSKIAGTIAKIGAVGFGVNYLRNGAIKAAGYENQAMDIYARTGQFGSDFNQGRTNAYKVGIKYGYGMQETMAMQDSLMNYSGFKDQESLNKDTSAVMKYSKVYGADSEAVSSMFGDLSKRGAYGQGQAEEFTNLLASSIKANGMQGREDEQLRALSQISNYLLSGKVNVTSDDFKNIAGIQATLASLNPSLRGEKGAELIQASKDVFNTQDEMDLRLFGYGTELTGFKGRMEAQRRLEKFKAGDPEATETLKKYANMYFPDRGIYGDTFSGYFHDKLGKTFEESDALIELLRRGKTINVDGKTGAKDQEDKLNNITNSKAYTQQQYEINKDNAQATMGNGLNNITQFPKRAFNGLGSPLQAVTDFGTKTAGTMYLGNQIPKLFSKISKAKTPKNVFGGFGKFGGKVKGIGGKISNKLGLITAIGYGTKAGYHLLNGENDRAAETAGEGAGVLGGGVAGAKAGAALGTVISPGLGTAVGGVLGGVAGGALGGFGGKKLGKGIFNLLGGSNLNTVEAKEVKIRDKEGQLLEHKERLLKKEEDIFNGILNGGNLNKVTPSNELNIKIDDKKEKPNQAIGSLNIAQQAHEDAINAVRDKISGGSRLSQALGDDFLGKVSAQYEVGGKNGGAISRIKGDYGGASYGLPQFSTTTGSADKFRKNAIDNSKFAEFFKGAGKAGTSSFDEAWKKAYESDPSGFNSLQQGFVYTGTVKPFINKVKNKKGVDLESSRALQELAFSTAIQFGGGSLGLKALGNIENGMSEEDIIKESFAAKRNNIDSFFKSSSRGLRNSLKSNRFKQEEQTLLGMVGQAPIPGYAVGAERITKDQLAFLHKDEAVLNKHDARQYREGTGTSVTAHSQSINVNLSVSGSNSDRELVEKMKVIMMQVMKNIPNVQAVNLSKGYTRVPN